MGRVMAALMAAAAAMSAQAATAGAQTDCMWNSLPERTRQLVVGSHWSAFVKNERYVDACMAFRAAAACKLPDHAETIEPLVRAFSQYIVNAHTEGWLTGDGGLTKARLDAAWQEMGEPWRARLAKAVEADDQKTLGDSVDEYLRRLGVAKPGEDIWVEASVHLQGRIVGPAREAALAKGLARAAGSPPFDAAEPPAQCKAP